MSAGLGHSPVETSTPHFPKRNVDIFSKPDGPSRRSAKNDVVTDGLFIDPYSDGERAVRAAVSSRLETDAARPQAAQRSPEGAALGSGGATVPPLPKQEIFSFRGSSSVSRWELLRKVQKLCKPENSEERGPAVVGCGMPGHQAASVNVHLRYSGETGETRAGVSGIYRCGSPWLCPTCSVFKAFERAERVQMAADATFKRGGMSALVVLTAAHSKDMSLSSIKALVETASNKARKGRVWVAAQRDYGILGVICGKEVTLSLEHGWHYHQHLSVLVDGPTTGEIAIANGDNEKLERLVAKRVKAAGDWLADAYKEKIRAAGGKVSDEHGCKVRVAHDAADASDCTAKGSMAWEVSGGHKDKTKSESSLTPWDIATRASDGDKFMFARWKEYEAVMPGTRSCIVSAALAKKLGIKPSANDKEEGGEQLYHENDDVVGRVEAPIWSRWMRHGLASTFLLRVEYNGEAGFANAVAQTEADSMEIERRWEARKAQYEREKADEQACSEADRLVRQAANHVGRHLDTTGTRRHIVDVVERIARDNPNAPRLDAGRVLIAANTHRGDMRDENWVIMREALAELTGYQIAA